MDIVDQVLDFMRAGFNSVNAVQGLIIAFVAALIMPGWNRLLVFTVAAALVHVIADVLLPVVSGGAALRLPPILETAFWREVGFLLVGYLIIITVLFLLRRLLLKR